MAAAQPRNTSPSSLLSSSSDETFVAARLRKYSPPRSLSFRFLPCPALSTMLPIFPCSARISSSCVSARSNRKSGYPHTHTHVHVSITQSSAPLTFHRLDPEIRTINSNCISGPRGQRLSRVAISFFSIEPLLRRGYIYICSYPRDWRLDRFQDVNETPFPEAPERAGTRRRWSSSAPRNSDITLIPVIAPNITCACLAELCSSLAREDWCTGNILFKEN